MSERLDPSLDKPLVAAITRQQFHSLARAIHDADTIHELAIYVARYQRALTDMRSLFDMIDAEIMGRLHHMRDAENDDDDAVRPHSMSEDGRP